MILQEIGFWERLQRRHVSQVAYDVTNGEVVPETGVGKLIFTCGDGDVIQFGARYERA